jgi:hypothetical protein
MIVIFIVKSIENLDSSIGRVLGCGLDNWSTITGRVKRFFPIPWDLGTTQNSVHCALVAPSYGVKWLGREADNTML